MRGQPGGICYEWSPRGVYMVYHIKWVGHHLQPAGDLSALVHHQILGCNSFVNGGNNHPHSIGKPPAFSQETHGISWGRAIFSNQTISIHISDHFCQKPSGFIEQNLHPRGILAPPWRPTHGKRGLNHYPCLPLKEISGILDSSKKVNTTLIHLPNPGKNPVSNVLESALRCNNWWTLNVIYIYV